MLLGDPDVVGTLRYALDNVTVLLWLLGTASAGGPDAARLAPADDARARRSTRPCAASSRGRGPVARTSWRPGSRSSARRGKLNEIRYAVLETGRDDGAAWVRAARAAIDTVLTAPRTAAD